VNEEDLEDCRVEAALYALGGLAPDKAQAVEGRLRCGCALCLAEVRQYSLVAEQLAFSVEPIEPPRELRQRLLERIQHSSEPSVAEHMTIVRRSDSDNGSDWVRMPFPGVEIRSLIGEKTLLIRMQPGAVFPKHGHPQREQCYVLEGSITDSAGVTLHAGDFVVMSAGIEHEPIRSEEGATFLITYAD
jgi:quercetin dioxygenase-like cupin family protein